MPTVNLEIENLVLKASRLDDGLWATVITDNETDTIHATVLSDASLGAIAALAIGIGEDLSADTAMVSSLLYEIAEPLVSSWPQDLRIIP